MAELVILTSSPARQFVSHAFDAMSSSPNLPDVNSLFVKRPAIRSRSRPISIPSNEMSTFASSSYSTRGMAALNNLEESAVPPIMPEDRPASTEPAKKATKKPRVVKEKIVVGGEGVQKPRKARAKKADSTSAPGQEQKETPARRLGPKKTQGDGQINISQGRLTKSSMVAGQPGEKKSIKKAKQPLLKTSKSSHYFVQAADDASPNHAAKTTDELDTSMSFAIPRRTDWTPPPATTETQHDNTTPSMIASCTEHFTENSSDENEGFKDLFGDFGFLPNEEKAAINAKAVNAVNTRKRKLIELVKTNDILVNDIVTKPKAAKKKARTLTGLATSAYDVDAEALMPILKFVNREQSPLGPQKVFNKPRKSRSKSPAKKLVAAKEKPGRTLFSPQSALKQVNRQEFVFGTSSQLAREDSPSFLRDLHLAMQASNSIDNDLFVKQSLELTTSSFKCASSGSSFGSRSLWEAANRGVDGELLEIESVDLTMTPAPARCRSFNENVESSSEAILIAPEPEARPQEKSSHESIEKAKKNACQQIKLPGHVSVAEASVAGDVLVVSARARGPVEDAIPESLLQSPIVNEKSTAGVRAQKVPAKRATAVKKTISLEKPDYEAFTDAKLAKEIRSYHFKPVKSRAGMISLLEKCWEGKQRMARGDLGTEALLQTSPVKSLSASQRPQITTNSPPKRARGRPRKELAFPSICEVASNNDYLQSDSDTSLALRQTPNKRGHRPQNIQDEISDSDAPITPSPPRRRASLIGTPPLPLEMSVESVESTNADASAQVALHEAITAAIRSCPRTTNLGEPSWHEKILLYDPIVLEDLSVWLNTVALGKVGWDGEVAPSEVKTWCISKGICCLWRENLRGGARARY